MLKDDEKHVVLRPHTYTAKVSGQGLDNTASKAATERLYTSTLRQLMRGDLVLLRKENKVHRQVARSLLDNGAASLELDNMPSRKTKGTYYLRRKVKSFNMTAPKEYKPVQKVIGSQFNAKLREGL